jgi:hypothetical protein
MAILPDEMSLGLRGQAVVKTSLSQFLILSGQGLAAMRRRDVTALEILRNERHGQD